MPEQNFNDQLHDLQRQITAAQLEINVSNHRRIETLAASTTESIRLLRRSITYCTIGVCLNSIGVIALALRILLR